MNINGLFDAAMVKKNEKWEHEIIHTKAELNEWLQYEHIKYSKELSFLGGLFCLTEKDFIWKYQKRLRKVEYYLNSEKKFRYLISRVMLARLSARLGINVRINSCGKGLRIVHISSVITSGDIGKDYTAFPNTLVGEGTRGGNPKLGNSVTSFTGATIVGDITIANNVIIGANSFANKSCFEEGATFAGIPAQIVKRRQHSDTNGEKA